MDYSIVIPVYNSTRSLTELVTRIKTVFVQKVNASYEIIFVDDASPNKDTWPALSELVDNHAEVKAIRLMRNFGKHGAVLCGMEEAVGKYIITMDDDLQHRPEDIPSLIQFKNHDVVIARFKEKEHSQLKRCFSSLNNRLETWLIGKPKEIINSPYKLINARVVKSITKIKTSNPSISALLFYTTRDVVMAPAHHDKRAYDQSAFTFTKAFKIFSNLLFNNSSALLRFIAVNGVVIALVSALQGVYFIYKKLFIGIPITGWASLITLLLFFGGMTLFSVGIVGEYLIRIINGIEQKPPYIVREKIG